MSRILAVDDVAFNLDVIASIFEDISPRVGVVTADGGQRALDMLRAGERVDVVLLDLQMPVKSGYDVLRELRADPVFARLRVVAMSAGAEEKARAIAAGAADFIVKPFDPGELLRRCLIQLGEARPAV